MKNGQHRPKAEGGGRKQDVFRNLYDFWRGRILGKGVRWEKKAAFQEELGKPQETNYLFAQGYSTAR